ncbi:MAG: hypothetical protein U1F98_03220 [Verrucomicrobiota bacterium]
MIKPAKLLVGLGVVVAIVGAGVLLGWLGSRSQGPTGPSVPAAAITNLTTPAPAPAVKMEPTTTTPAPVNPITTTPTPATNVYAANWEDKISDIIGSDAEDTNKVKLLLELFPQLPEEGQVETVQHLSNLVSDEDYAPLAAMLKDTKLPEPVLDVLLGDALNRPNSIKLPLLLDVAQNPNNPKAGEAKDLMELYLDESDPSKWPELLPKWLKDNPD